MHKSLVYVLEGGWVGGIGATYSLPLGQQNKKRIELKKGYTFIALCTTFVLP